MKTRPSFILFAAAAALLVGAAGLVRSQESGAPVQAQPKNPPRPKAPEREGSMQKIVVHGKALEGNLEGDSPDRDVIVYLPPGYAKNGNQRYPVVYFLHGYRSHGSGYTNALWASDGADKDIASGAAKEMIVVFPDAYTKWEGSFYVNSPTTGDWETFITRDLVEYIDGHYRTMASRDSRGLAGHSMGGYGTLRIGMRHPDLYAAIYAMSSCCMLTNPYVSPTPTGGSQFPKINEALAAAWAPNPKNPPNFFDLPVKDGQVVPEVAAKYLANAPLALVDQYATNLKKYRGFAMDVGTEDSLITSNQQMDAELTRLGVPHTFETYSGTHMSNIKDRWVEKVVPFFSSNLAFATPKK